MKVLEIHFPLTHNDVYEIIKEKYNPGVESLLIIFTNRFSPEYLFTKQDVILEIEEKLKSRKKEWFDYKEGKVFLNLDKLRIIKGLESLEWLKGNFPIDPEINFKEKVIEVRINIRKENLKTMSYQKRIFLSHKTANKEIVREYKKTLSVLGYNPWIDEQDMPAGTVAHRAISEGFKDSCAVIFFITTDFEDDRWLRAEIDHAINEKIEKGDKFSIITLVLSEDAIVPEPLKTYIWKSPKNNLEGLRDIISALPKM
ncbi:MAG: hypothetical protein ACI9Y7_003233 [Dokdonia sp.]|jgi:hypothetical protein